MSDTIKSVTAKIGADASDFLKELKKVDNEINSTAKYAKELQKNLELDFNEQKFVKSQKKVQEALDLTTKKAEAIRKRLEYLEKEGRVNTTEYVRLQTELEKNETTARKLNEQLEKIKNIKLDRAINSINKIQGGLEKAANATKAISAAAIGAIAGIVKLGSDAAATGGEIQDMADRLGIAAEEIQRYDYIALQSGVETDQLVKSMAKARDAIGTGLAGGTSTAVTALQTLFGDLKKIPTGTEESFTAIIGQLAKVEDSTLQAYYANEIFGERLATNLIPLINNGADRLNQLNIEFEQIGYLSNEQVKSLADFDDELNIMREELDRAKTELGLEFIPIMRDFMVILRDDIIPLIEKLSEWFGNLSEQERKTAEKALVLGIAIGPVLSLFANMLKIAPSLIKFFVDLKNKVNLTTIGFAALGGAVALTFDLIANWQEMSTVEKILKSLAVAALVAAAAITVFHASWSLGIAVGAITAGVVAGIAMIKAASEEIGVDAGIGSESDLTNSANSGYNIPKDSSRGNTTTYNEDYSKYDININMNASGDLEYDSKALADEVIKQIVLKKQAAGY